MRNLWFDMVISMKEMMNSSDLKLLYKYALTHCKEMCPADRDPEVCVVMFRLGKMLGNPPPCTDVYGDFSIAIFQRIIKEIEERHGMPIEQFLQSVKSSNVKSLQDMEDEMDGSFALKVIRILRGEKSEMP